MDLLEAIETLKGGLMWIGLSVLAAIVGGCVAAWLYHLTRGMEAWWRGLRTWFDKIVFIGLFAACALIGGTKTNSPPLLQMPFPPSLSQAVVQEITEGEIAQGWRLESIATNDAVSYVMPDGVSPSFNWHRRGTFGEWARLDFGDFIFPLGTNDETFSSFSVFNDGRIRPAPRDVAREICAVGVPMLAMQGASRFWVADASAVAGRPPYQAKLLTWENFFLNADTNTPVSAQIELFPNGDFTTRSNNVEQIYRRVAYFDWDGDGLENSVDPDPLVAGPDAHGTNGEWYNKVCSNVFSAVATSCDPPGSGAGGAQLVAPVELSWREGVNSNAYYFVDVVTERGPAPIYFTGDRDSRLGNPVVVARAFETNRVPLLIGIYYAITSTVPFAVSYPMDYMYPVLETNEPCRASVRWPLEFSVEPDGYGGFYTSVIPYDPGGTFQWGNGGTGGMRSGGVRSGDSGFSSCEYSIYGNWLGFTCVGPDCGCHGCSVDGTYTVECSTFNLPTLFCGCSYDDPDDPPDDPPEEPFPETPSVAITFGKPVIIFEDRYEASPDNCVEKRSTTNTLTVTASGGTSGATLILASANLECLQRIGGGSVSLPAEIVLGPYMSYTATFRCVGAGDGGTPLVSGIISGLDGTDSSYAQTTVVRVEIQKLRNAPVNQCLNRHEYGIGEKILFHQSPGSPEVEILAEDVKILGVGTRTIEWGISNIEHTLSFSLNDVRYVPLVKIHKPNGIEGYDAQAVTNGFPPGIAGGLELVQRYRLLPLTVDFSALEIEEVPCDDAIPPTGYFAYTPPKVFPRTHSTAAGAGVWNVVVAGNYIEAKNGGRMRDHAGYPDQLPRMMPDGTTTNNPAYGWLGGSLVWKVPFGWRLKDSHNEGPIGIFAEGTRQIQSITETGDYSVEKLGHKATRQINGTLTLE